MVKLVWDWGLPPQLAYSRVFLLVPVRVLPRAALRPVSLLFLVALTGIERV